MSTNCKYIQIAYFVVSLGVGVEIVSGKPTGIILGFCDALVSGKALSSCSIAGWLVLFAMGASLNTWLNTWLEVGVELLFDVSTKVSSFTQNQ